MVGGLPSYYHGPNMEWGNRFLPKSGLANAPGPLNPPALQFIEPFVYKRQLDIGTYLLYFCPVKAVPTAKAEDAFRTSPI